MSIYGSGLVDFDADNHAFAEDDAAWRGTRCAKWKSCAETDDWQLTTIAGSHYLLDSDVTCTCLCGPIAYQGSHILPVVLDRRQAETMRDRLTFWLEHSDPAKAENWEAAR
jgi:hypothetical protein